MKVLVTGATGFVGVRLCRELFLRGHDIVALTRNTESARDRISVPCEVYKWNPSAGLPPEEALAGVDVVVNLMGENIASGRWDERRKEAITNSRVQGTRNLVKALNQSSSSRPKSLISYSAIGFYPVDQLAPLDEQSSHGEGFLSEVCSRWEQEANRFEKPGRTVILRVGTVIGRGGGAVSKLRNIIKLGLGGPVGSGKQMMSWIHVDDLVNLTVMACEDDRFEGVYNAVAPEPVTNRQFTNALASAVKKPALLPAPKSILKLVFGEMAQVILSGQNIVSCRLPETSFQFKYPKITSAAKEAMGVASIGLNGQEVVCEQFESFQYIDRDISDVFRFFSVPDNLSAITPPFLHFKILSVSTPNIEKDTRIRYQLSLHGIPINWKTLIKEWDEGNEFVDFQLSGPYKYWHHRHVFIPREQGTLIIDRVDYRLPFGVLGDLLAGWYVKRDVSQIFAYRRQAIKRLLAAPYRKLKKVSQGQEQRLPGEGAYKKI